MKIGFVCRKFGGVVGGVEKMASLIMEDLVKKGHKVYLITLDNSEAEPFFPLSPEIRWLKVDIGNPDRKASLGTIIKRFKKIRNFIKENNVQAIIGFQVGSFALAFFSTLLLNIKRIAAERNSPQLFNYIRKGKFNRFICNLYLFFADIITIQLEEYRELYPKILTSKLRVINNPVYKQSLEKLKSEHFKIINIGRFSVQKNQKFLIESFQKIAYKYPDLTLEIYGDGELQEKLLSYTKDLGLEKRVLFKGVVKDISTLYNNKVIFAFPSLWEGFPNALAEAISFDVPVIGLKSTYGVSELISKYGSGLLCSNNVKDFSKGLEEILNNFEKFTYNACSSKLLQECSPEKIFLKWEEQFRALLNER